VTAGPEARPVASAPRERGWRRLVLGLAAATALTATAAWPPSLALLQVAVWWLVPVPSVLSLLFAGLVACAIAAWARGGRVLTAVTAVSMLVVWLVRQPVGDLLDRVHMGWALLVTATFGWWAMAVDPRPFLARALPAVGVAGLVALLVLTSAPEGFDLSAVGARAEERFLRQRDASVEAWQKRLTEPRWVSVSTRAPAVRRLADRVAGGMATLTPPTPVLPALFVLETLAVLALAWGTWHRVSRVRLGPPLAAWSAFRFSDQLVWGLVAGATLVLLPSLDGWRDVGVNLVVVFGALHIVRGLGVLVWWLPERWWAAVLVLLVAGIPLLGPVLVLATVAVLALGLGLGDTWRDFRRTTRSWRAASRP
jgi:hypothetical protein